METYPIDIEPEQILRWIMAEREATPSAFRITASRSAESQELPAWPELRLGDQEREDLNEIATVATLEIAPADSSEGWRLTIVVVDEAGPRLSDRGSAMGGEEEIDLDTFYRDFICCRRGTVDVTAAADKAGKPRLNRLLKKIETNRHAGVHGKR